jgi:hypothetical protein
MGFVGFAAGIPPAARSRSRRHNQIRPLFSGVSGRPSRMREHFPSSHDPEKCNPLFEKQHAQEKPLAGGFPAR